MKNARRTAEIDALLRRSRRGSQVHLVGDGFSFRDLRILRKYWSNKPRRVTSVSLGLGFFLRKRENKWYLKKHGEPLGLVGRARFGDGNYGVITLVAI